MPPKVNKQASQQRPGIVASISSYFSPAYDPHLHRNTKKPTNYIETLIHFLKSSIGAGILSMPKAYSQAGLVIGVLGTLLIALLITYSLHLLVRCQYALCKRKRVPLLTYPQSVKEALLIGPQCMRGCARFAPGLVNFFIISYQIGICCIYMVFIGRSLFAMFHPFSFFGMIIYEIKGELAKQFTLLEYMLMSTIPLFLIVCIPNLKILAIFSAIANIFTFIGLGILMYDLRSTEKKSNAPLDLWGTPRDYPLFIGTILFGLVTVAVVIALENNMKNPKGFVKPAGVLNVSMFIVVAMHVIVGVIGYMFCVSSCSDTIVLDLNPMTITFVLVQLLYVIAITISYGLQNYVPVDVIWTSVRERLDENTSKKKLCAIEYMIRFILFLITFAIAATVPRLGLFISLFGTFCLSMLGLCFPALMDLCLSVAETSETGAGGGGLRRAKDGVLIFISIVALCLGTFTSMRSIIRSFL